MGAVWEAKHLRLPGKRVVVKVLLFGATDATVLARFRREAEIASKLGHPNIVAGPRLQRRWPTARRTSCSSTSQGESLAQRLARGPLPLEAGQGDRRARSARRWRPPIARASSTAISSRRTSSSARRRSTASVRRRREGARLRHLEDPRLARRCRRRTRRCSGRRSTWRPSRRPGSNDEIDARTDMFAFGAIVVRDAGGQPAVHGRHAGRGHPRDRLHAYAVAGGAGAGHPARDRRGDRAGAWRRTATRASRRQQLRQGGDVAQPRHRADGPGRPGADPVAAPTERVAARPILGVVLHRSSAWRWSRSVAVAVWKTRPRETAGGSPPLRHHRPRARDAGALGYAARRHRLPRPRIPTQTRTPTPAEPRAAAKPEAAESRKAKAGKETKDALSAEAARDLEEAEAALAAGKPARRSGSRNTACTRSRPASAYAHIARARCAQGDHRQRQGGAAKVAARDRAARRAGLWQTGRRRRWSAVRRAVGWQWRWSLSVAGGRARREPPSSPGKLFVGPEG